MSAVHNVTEGPNGLPAVTSAITIQGNGATIERSAAGGTPELRMLFVGVLGNLRLEALTLRNGAGRSLDSNGDCSGGGALRAHDGQLTEALAQKSVATFGAVHVLCNNAGVAVGKTTWEHTVADWEWVLGVNLWGVIHGVRTFVPIMLEQGTEGHIVNTASVAGLLASGFKPSYDVSKFGVVALSESLYRELEAIGAQVRVSVLCPGLVNTRIIASDRNRPGRLENDAAIEAAGHRPEAVAYMQRLGEGLRTRGSPPSYVADAVLQGIREERFYILPHDDFDVQIRERMESILERRNPPARP